MTLSNRAPRRRPGGGFTLVELLVVVFIVILVSVVALPTIIPALNNRQVGEAARILQAAIAGARDLAIRNNSTAGIRLMPDDSITGALVSNRIISIEPAPDISEGLVTFPNFYNFANASATPNNPAQLNAMWADSAGNAVLPPAFPFPFPGDTTYTVGRGNYPWLPSAKGGSSSAATPPAFQVLLVEQAVYLANTPPPSPSLPTAPTTNWFWNIRIGDRFRFEGAGRFYTVVGPMTVANPEYFVNDGLPGATTTLLETYAVPGSPPTPVNVRPEFLFLVDGVDNNNDGYIDNGMNGVNENVNYTAGGKPIIDEETLEWIETETWQGAQEAQARNYQAPPLVPGAVPVLPVLTYTITRRPVPSPGAQEVALPSGVVVDLTSWDSTRERSRLPVDPNNRYVDVMVNQSGQVVPTTTYSNPGSASMDQSFYHFWIADRSDIFPTGASTTPQLPIPLPASGVPYTGVTQYLKKDRRLVTLFTRTGQIVTNSIESFDFANAYTTSYDQNVPFDLAQLGIREAK